MRIPEQARKSVYRFVGAVGRLILVRDGRFIVTFHGISGRKRPDMPVDSQPYLDIQDLCTILLWIRERFPLLSPQQFFDRSTRGVLITFDDGMANNWSNALPVLEELQAPALFFVTTQHIIQPDNWLSGTVAIAAKAWQNSHEIPDEIKKDFYDGMSAEQLNLCSRSPWVTIGSHTISHPMLTNCQPGVLKNELEGSRQYLETITGKPVQYLAYPSGDYNRAVVDAAKQAGYLAAFAVDPLPVGLPHFEIPRVGLYSADPAYLSMKLSGFHRRPVRQAYF